MKIELKIIQCLIVFAVGFVFFSCTANYYFNEAEKLSEARKYTEAIELFNKAIEKDTTFLEAYNNRGTAKSAIGDYEGAIKDYQKVLEIDSQNTMAFFNIGNNYKRLENYQSAIEYYNKALDTKGKGPIYFETVPNPFLGIEGNPSDVPLREICYERGIAYYYVDDFQNAICDFNTALRQNYETAVCHYWLGYIYLALGYIESACLHFNSASLYGDEDAREAMKKYCK